MSMTTCNICGGEYNANRLDEHCCSCVALERQVAALTKERDDNSFSDHKLIISLRDKLAAAQEQITALTQELDEWKAKAKECSDWGEERRQAALDALEMAMERKEELAAAQAVNEKLREALEQVADGFGVS